MNNSNIPILGRRTKKRVVVVDDTLRRNVCVRVTPLVREQYQKKFGHSLPDNVRFLPLEVKGRKVQDVVKVRHVYEGPRLTHAVTRARRWMRSPRYGKAGGAPHHITLAMMAFRQADPRGFEVAHNETVALRERRPL